MKKWILLIILTMLIVSGLEGFIRSFYGEFPYDAKSISESKKLGVFIKKVGSSLF